MRGVLLLSLLLGACQSASDDPNKAMIDDEIVLQQFLDLNSKLENTSYPLLKANIEDCAQTDNSIGIFAHTIHDFPEDMGALVSEKLGVKDTPFIRHILPGSPADKAGLKTGDEILAVNDVDMIKGDQARLFFETIGRSEFTQGQVVIKISRDGREKRVEVIPEKICGYPVQLFFSDDLNAYTDGDEIWVTTELVNRLSSEEGLALVIAHELAHATEGHIFETPTREFELEADRIGMSYLVKAGFDGNLALAEWAANPLNHKSQIGESHPSFEERWRVLDAALQAAKTP